MHKDPLAPLTNLEPEKLVSKDGKDSLAEFILALSLVFNDLKGIVNWRECRHPCVKVLEVRGWVS